MPQAATAKCRDLGYNSVVELGDLSRALLLVICIEQGLANGISRLLALGAISKIIRSYRVRLHGWTVLYLAAYLGNRPLV